MVIVTAGTAGTAAVRVDGGRAVGCARSASRRSSASTTRTSAASAGTSAIAARSTHVARAGRARSTSACSPRRSSARASWRSFHTPPSTCARSCRRRRARWPVARRRRSPIVRRTDPASFGQLRGTAHRRHRLRWRRARQRPVRPWVLARLRRRQQRPPLPRHPPLPRRDARKHPRHSGTPRRSHEAGPRGPAFSLRPEERRQERKVPEDDEQDEERDADRDTARWILARGRDAETSEDPEADPVERGQEGRGEPRREDGQRVQRHAAREEPERKTREQRGGDHEERAVEHETRKRVEDREARLLRKEDDLEDRPRADAKRESDDEKRHLERGPAASEDPGPAPVDGPRSEQRRDDERPVPVERVVTERHARVLENDGGDRDDGSGRETDDRDADPASEARGGGGPARHEGRPSIVESGLEVQAPERRRPPTEDNVGLASTVLLNRSGAPSANRVMPGLCPVMQGGACDGERDASCALRANEARQARHAKLEHPDEQDEDGEEGDRAACPWLLPRVSRRGARDGAHRERRKDEREEEAADVADRERAE